MYDNQRVRMINGQAQRVRTFDGRATYAGNVRRYRIDGKRVTAREFDALRAAAYLSGAVTCCRTKTRGDVVQQFASYTVIDS